MRRALGWGVAALGLAVAPFLLPAFYLVLLSEILIWALFAMGFNLLYGYAGLLSLGQSVYFGVGAYGVALTVLYLTPDVGAGVGVGVLAAVACAALIGAVAIRIRGHGFIVFTAVGALVFYGLVTDPTLSAWTGGDNGRAFELLPLFGLDLAKVTTRYAVIALTVAGALLALRWLLGTPLGLAWRLVRDNERRAAELGYNTQWLKWQAFVYAGALAGLAGTLFAVFNRFVDASLLHWILSADVIVWTLAGGAGTLLGPLVGVLGFKVLEEALSRWWAHGHPLLLGIALLLVVRFFPEGVWGTLQRRLRSPTSAKSRSACAQRNTDSTIEKS